jgi:hypothetical protein
MVDRLGDADCSEGEQVVFLTPAAVLLGADISFWPTTLLFSRGVRRADEG